MAYDYWVKCNFMTTEAQFNAAVTADIKALVARCVCGAEDYPTLEQASKWKPDADFRIACDNCGRILYAPSQAECVRDWERIGAKTFDAQEIAELTEYLSTQSYAAGGLDGWSSAQTEIAALKLALDACVDSAFEQDKTSAALLSGVTKVLALLDDEADVVDGEHGPIPNSAMRIAQELREAITQARETK